MARSRRPKPSAKMVTLDINTSSKKWQLCVYIRLSKEDTKKARSEPQLKSESIKNQKSILKSWIEDYFEPGTYEIVGVFEDDGLSGTDDTRENLCVS